MSRRYSVFLLFGRTGESVEKVQRPVTSRAQGLRVVESSSTYFKRGSNFQGFVWDHKLKRRIG